MSIQAFFAYILYRMRIPWWPALITLVQVCRCSQTLPLDNRCGSRVQPIATATMMNLINGCNLAVLWFIKHKRCIIRLAALLYYFYHNIISIPVIPEHNENILITQFKNISLKTHSTLWQRSRLKKQQLHTNRIKRPKTLTFNVKDHNNVVSQPFIPECKRTLKVKFVTTRVP